jgi:hypothetical protein
LIKGPDTVDAATRPSTYGSELIQLATNTSTPASGTWEVTISPCKGLIDTNAGAC